MRCKTEECGIGPVLEHRVRFEQVEIVERPLDIYTEHHNYWMAFSLIYTSLLWVIFLFSHFGGESIFSYVCNLVYISYCLKKSFQNFFVVLKSYILKHILTGRNYKSNLEFSLNHYFNEMICHLKLMQL